MRRIGLGLLVVLAAFTVPAAELTVVVSGEGTTVPAAGTITVDDGSVVDLSALTIAGSGFAFSQWSGDVSTQSQATTITMNGDKTVTAEFVTGDVTLTITESGAGAGVGETNPGPGAHAYLLGRTASLASLPGTAYFGGWTGDVTSTYPTIDVVMNADKVINANFTTFGRTVNLTAGVGGTTLPPPGSYRYTTDLYIEIQAIVTVPGQEFKNWSGDIEPNLVILPKVSFPVDANRNIAAVFGDDTKDWTLFVNISGIGSSSPAGSFLRFDTGETATVQAIGLAGSNHAFASWTGAVNTTSETVSVVMNGNKTITANFVSPPDVTLTINTAGPGSTTPFPGVQGYIAGRTARLTAIPSTGKFFSGWTGDIVTLAPVTDLVMGTSKQVTASFADAGYNLTVAKFGAGSVGLPIDTYALADGIPVPLNAVPDAGNRFVKWTGDLGDADPLNPVLTLTMDRARSVRAIFVPQDSYYVRVYVNGQGNSAPAAGEYAFTANTNAYFAALPKPGYVFTHWSGDVTPQQAVLKQFFYRVTKDSELTVHFAQGETTLTLLISGQGSVNPTPGTYTYLNTDSATLTATNIPGSLFAFSRWDGDVGEQDPFSSTLTLAMLTNRTITAVFEPQGEGEIAFQACDQDLNAKVELSELLRVVQFYNAGGLRCADDPSDSEDGYLAGVIGLSNCAPYTSDCNPQDWSISLTELLRTIQFYNAQSYYYCPGEATEDGFCPGTPG